MSYICKNAPECGARSMVDPFQDDTCDFCFDDEIAKRLDGDRLLSFWIDTGQTTKTEALFYSQRT